jgi:hypothetical protein
MIYEMIASQIMFWGITLFSCLIWWEFYKSINGRMRVLVLRLFATKIWIYGLAGAYYLAWDFGYFRDMSGLWLRLICNLPMVIVMFEWYKYVKYKK